MSADNDAARTAFRSTLTSNSTAEIAILFGPWLAILGLLTWGAMALISWALSSWTVVTLLVGSLYWLLPYLYRKPYRIPRDLVDKHRARLNVCVVGAGFSGICMGVKLKEAGIPFVIIEKGSKVGGTWRDNIYPGVAVDIFSYLYQFSFYINPKWSSLYAPGREILAYLEDCCAHFGLNDHIRLSTSVNSAKWIEQDNKWEVQIKGASGQDEVLVCSHVISACGFLRDPKTPGFKGMESFQGQSFHSARWESHCDLRDKRVAVIGTGSSAVQIIPAIVDRVKELYVFQRSGNWHYERDDFPPPEWLKSGLKYAPSIFGTLTRMLLFIKYELTIPWLFTTKFTWINRFNKWWITGQIKKECKGDQELIAKAVPNFDIGCKRVRVVTGFYNTFSDNPGKSHLVTNPIEAITETGVKTKEGKEYEVDVITYATGFDIENSICGFDVTGRDSEASMRDALVSSNHSSATAHLGINMHNFPNMFILMGPNTVLAHNSVIFMLECQVDYVINALKQMMEHDIKVIEVKKSRVSEFRGEMDALTDLRPFASPTCNSWYKNRHGFNSIIWPTSCLQYWWMTRTANLLRDFKLTY